MKSLVQRLAIGAFLAIFGWCLGEPGAKQKDLQDVVVRILQEGAQGGAPVQVQGTEGGPDETALAEQLKQAIINVLSVIDVSLSYWEIQEHNQKMYLLSQGPRAWLAQWQGKATVEQQIKTNTDNLQKKRQKLWEELGELQKALRFKESQKISQSEQKSDEIEPEHLMTSGLEKPISLPSDKQCVEKYQKSKLASIAAWQKPSHTRRNLFSYAVAGAGLLAAGIAAYQGRDQLRSVTSSMHNVWNHCFSQSDQLAVVDTKVIRNNLYEKFARFSATMRRGFSSKINGLAISEEKKAALIGAAACGDSIKAADLMGDLDKDLRSKFSEKPVLKGFSLGGGNLKRDMYNAAQGVILSNFDVSFMFLADQLRDYMKWLLFDVWNPVEASQQMLCSEIGRLRGRLRSLAWQIPCAVTAVGLSVGIKKIIDLKRNKNFQLLRSTLSEVSIAIFARQNCSDEKRGALVYHCHKLRAQVRNFLPNNQTRWDIEKKLQNFEEEKEQNQTFIIKELRKTYSCFRA